MSIERESRPLPVITPVEKGYFDGARDGRLLLQRCTECSHVWFPPSSLCPRCLSAALVWEPMSGAGSVWSFIVMHRSYFRAFDADIPYNVALIELDEGPLMISNLVDCDIAKVKCGTRVKAMFRPVTDDVTLPFFTTVPEGSGNT